MMPAEEPDFDGNNNNSDENYPAASCDPVAVAFPGMMLKIIRSRPRNFNQWQRRCRWLWRWQLCDCITALRCLALRCGPGKCCWYWYCYLESWHLLEYPGCRQEASSSQHTLSSNSWQFSVKNNGREQHKLRPGTFCGATKSPERRRTHTCWVVRPHF